MATKLNSATGELLPVVTTPLGTQLPSTEVRRAPLEGLEGLGVDDLVIPRWSLVQPLSNMDGASEHVGQWHRNLDGEFRKVLECVILAIVPSRVKFPFGQTKGAPECVSRDGINGSKWGACGTCRFNWKVSAELRKEKANAERGQKIEECHDGYTLLLVDDLDAFTPAVYGVKSKAVRPVQTYYSQLKFQRKAPAFHCVTRIESVQETNDLGRYYVPKFVLGEPFDAEQYAMWREAYQTLNVIARREDAFNPAQDVEPAFNAESLNPPGTTDDF